MTPAEGFGMLAVGLIAMAIGGTIFYIVINKIEKNKIEEEERKKMEKLYGRNIDY